MDIIRQFSGGDHRNVSTCLYGQSTPKKFRHWRVYLSSLKTKTEIPFLGVSPLKFLSIQLHGASTQIFNQKRQLYSTKISMFPKPFAKHNNSLKYCQCSCGTNRSNQENDQRNFLSRLKTEGRDQSSSSKLIDKDANFNDAYDKKHRVRGRNKQNQQGNKPLISQLQRQHSNHKPNFNCAVKNEYNLKYSSELISRGRSNLNYTPIGKIQDVFQEIVDKEQKPIRCQKSTMPSMANVRERCMAPKESKPKISINYVKRKATANYDSKSPEIKTLKSRSHSTANITSKRGEPLIVSHPSFNNMQPAIRKLSRPGLGDLCFKPTESIVADDSDLISEVLSSRSIESRLLEVDSEWGSTLDELFKRRHRKDPLD